MQEVKLDMLFSCLCMCRWVQAKQRMREKWKDFHHRTCDESSKELGKEEIKRGSEEKDRSSLPRTNFLPWCLVVGLPLNLSRDKAVQGIIHLPVPFSISSTLAGTFCPPLKHKIPSVRNSRTHSPLCSLFSSSSSLLWITNAPQESNVGGVIEQPEKETNSEKGNQLKDALEAQRVLVRAGKEMSRGRR